jgi:hypothetical protein
MIFSSPVYKLAYDCEMKGMHLKGWDLIPKDHILKLCLNFLEVKYGRGCNSSSGNCSS